MKISYATRMISVIALLFCTHLNAQYTINDTFADLTECSSMTRDIFVVWWDNDFNYADEVDVLLDQMIEYRNTCLNDLNMMDPPSALDGYFQNIYIHGDGGYFDTNGWGNGVGTDSNGYPFYTLPYGLMTDYVNLGHEIFHIFQYNANSPGFAYSGDSAWYIEASANWFGAKQSITSQRAFIEAESLVRLPHIPLWVSFDNFPDDYPDNWQRFVHQYALGLFLYYLTDVENVSPNLISEGFYANTSELPQEYLFNQIGATDFRNLFIDFAARITNDFDFITPQQAAANEQEWNDYADPADDNEITETFDETGTDDWYQPATNLTTNAWSFNTYKLNNTSATTYTFEIQGNPTGTYGDPSYFQGKVLVKNTVGTTTFYDIPMTSDIEGSLSLDLTSNDTEVSFIIASMPEIFEDANPEFQVFPYQIRISNDTLALSEFDLVDPEKTAIARYNLLGQKIAVDNTLKGVQIILYSDGTAQKIVIY